MSVNKLFQEIEGIREYANWQAAFGQPQQVEGKTIIPVAQVSYGWGLGFGSGGAPSEADEPGAAGEGAGGGGGAATTPLGAIVVTPDRVTFEPTMNQGRVALAGIGLIALIIYQIAKTVRAFAGSRHPVS